MITVQITPKPKLSWEYMLIAAISCGAFIFILTHRKEKPYFVTHGVDAHGTCYLGHYWDTIDQGVADLMKRAQPFFGTVKELRVDHKKTLDVPNDFLV